MAEKKTSIVSSPLFGALNNIVPIKRSARTMSKTQTSFQGFLRFMDVEIKSMQAIKMPSNKKLKEISNINLASTFGRPGNLLTSLASGALDAAGFIGDMFGRGKKPRPKAGQKVPTKGPKVRLGGLKALGIANAAFAGLDFATGLQEGESVGKAAAGAGGALAGSLLGGAIGQAIIPIPGLGFVVGSMAGNFLGGYLADRGYEAATGTGSQNIEQKTKRRLKEQEKKQKALAASAGAKLTLPEVIDKFENVVIKFERASLASGFESGSSGTEEGFGEKSNEGSGEAPTAPTEPYEGPISGDSFFPLPGGIITNRSVGIKGGEYGAPRSYGPHSGQDIGGLPPGSPVVAWKTGKVRYTGSVEPGDTIMTIDHGGGEQSVYKHVVPTVPAGTVVYGGQQIAKLFAAVRYPEHLHFEIWKNGSHKNPNGAISAAQKIPSPLTAEKAKEQSEKSSGKSSVASGTTPQSAPPTQQAAVVTKTNLMPPNSKPTPTKQELSGMSTDQLKGMLDPTKTGASNQSVFKAAQEARTKGQESGLSGEALEREVMIASIRAKEAEAQVVAMSQQPVIPQQLQQYPDYNLPQSSVTVIPMVMGSGNGSQRPMVISSGGGGGGGGGTVIMPPPPQGVLLNSLFKTMLLTNLSAM